MGCSGKADFKVWVPEGVQLTSHEALIPDYARDFERPGFSQLLPREPKGGAGAGAGPAAGGSKKQAGKKKVAAAAAGGDDY